MDPSISSHIEALVMEKKQWETEFLPIEVQVMHEETTRIVNMADFIGVGIRGNRDNNCKELRQYLPNHFSTNTHSFRREQLIPFIAKACAQSGFKVSTKGWEKSWQKIRFFCQHSRVHDDRKSAAAASLPSTQSPMLSENKDMNTSNDPHNMQQNKGPSQP
jgi:hypothetical protein